MVTKTLTEPIITSRQHIFVFLFSSPICKSCDFKQKVTFSKYKIDDVR